MASNVSFHHVRTVTTGLQRVGTDLKRIVLVRINSLTRNKTLHYVCYQLFIFNGTIFATSTSLIILIIGTWTFQLGLNRGDGLYPHESGRRYLEVTLWYVGFVTLLVLFSIALISLATIIGILIRSIFWMHFAFGATIIFILYETIFSYIVSLYHSHMTIPFLDNLIEIVTNEYMENLVFKSFFDDIQRYFKCCGVGIGGYHEWSRTYIRQCLSDSISNLRCTVPISCCNTDKNTSILGCYEQVRGKSALDLDNTLYVAGCISKYFFFYWKGVTAIPMIIMIPIFGVHTFFAFSYLLIIDHFRHLERITRHVEFPEKSVDP